MLADVTRGGVRSVGHSLILKLRLAHEDVAPDAAPSVSGWSGTRGARWDRGWSTSAPVWTQRRGSIMLSFMVT